MTDHGVDASTTGASDRGAETTRNDDADAAPPQKVDAGSTERDVDAGDARFSDADIDALVHETAPIAPVAPSCAPTQEKCDGSDNDCDGVVDNIDPASCSAGVGECASAGQYKCAGNDRVCACATPSQETQLLRFATARTTITTARSTTSSLALAWLEPANVRDRARSGARAPIACATQFKKRASPRSAMERQRLRRGGRRSQAGL